MEPVQTLHKTHRDNNRHRNFMLLLVPSIVFAVTLAILLRNRWVTTSIQVDAPIAIEKSTILVKGIQVSVSVARTPAEQSRGLSGVSKLGDTEGMLFVFPSKARPPFWMKDMLIPLDFIWIADGKVTQTMENAPAPAFGTPDSNLKLYIPNDLVDSVLEVNAGFVAKNNIKVGDSVIE